jgi:integrase
VWLLDDVLRLNLPTLLLGLQYRGTRAGHATDIRRRDNVKAPAARERPGARHRRRGSHARSGYPCLGPRVLRGAETWPQWYCKYRAGGRQVQKRLGPAWLDPGQPPPGYYTRRTAEADLAAILVDARRGALPRATGCGATVREAAEEWLRHCEWERGVKASTLSEYRSVVDAHIVPRFGHYRLEAVTAREVEAWAAELLASGRSRRTVNKILVMFGGVFERARRVWALTSNPLADVSRKREHYSGDLDFFSPDEVMMLVRAAASEQDAAVFLTAAYTGLRRGELVALKWRDVFFDRESIRVRASYSYGTLTTPKSGKVRTVPMVPAVAEALARLGRRDLFVSDDDLVFPGLAGDYLDGSALRRRYKAALKRAGLRELPSTTCATASARSPSTLSPSSK